MRGFRKLRRSYWIISDVIGVPDLQPRSLAFAYYQFWHKLASRQQFSKSDVGLGLYWVVGLAVAAALLVSSAFFWSRPFGGVVSRLWDAGSIGVAALLALALAGAPPRRRPSSEPAPRESPGLDLTTMPIGTAIRVPIAGKSQP